MLSCSIWFSAPSFWMGGGLESRFAGRVYGADGAVQVTRHHPHRTHDLHSGCQDDHLSKNSVQKSICCNSTSNAPDDRHMYLKHVELKIHQYNYLVAPSWHFKLFHEEDAQSNNPQVYLNVSHLFKNWQYVGSTFPNIFSSLNCLVAG